LTGRRTGAPNLDNVPERDDEWRYDPALDYHDPTAGIGGAPPAASALVLRAWLAAIAIAVCIASILLTLAVDGPVALVVVLGVVAFTAVLDLVVVIRRRHRLQP
jgi:hypothetical protein